MKRAALVQIQVGELKYYFDAFHTGSTFSIQRSRNEAKWRPEASEEFSRLRANNPERTQVRRLLRIHRISSYDASFLD